MVVSPGLPGIYCLYDSRRVKEGVKEGGARALKVVCLVVCLYRTVLVLFTLVVGSVLFSAAEEV